MSPDKLLAHVLNPQKEHAPRKDIVVHSVETETWYYDIINELLSLQTVATMKGRGNTKPTSGRANPANGGRGNAGSGGTRPPPRTGTVAAIGAFLDLGREMNHGSVSAWMRKFEDYTRTNYN